eukprot:3126701-Pyramimonas_sp.AAC.1
MKSASTDETVVFNISGMLERNLTTQFLGLAALSSHRKMTRQYSWKNSPFDWHFFLISSLGTPG